MSLEGHVDREKLKTVINTINKLVDECILDFTDSQLRIQIADKPQIGLMKVYIENELFDELEHDGSEVGIRTDKLSDIVDIMDSESIVLSDSNDERIHVSDGEMLYRMEKVDTDLIENNKSLPALDNDCTVILNGSDFIDVVNGASKISQFMIIGCENNDDFYMKGEGEESSVEFTDAEEVAKTVIDDIESAYRVDYLRSITNSISRDGKVKLMFSDDYPVNIQFEPISNVSIEYIIAPRIVNELEGDNNV